MSLSTHVLDAVRGAPARRGRRPAGAPDGRRLVLWPRRVTDDDGRVAGWDAAARGRAPPGVRHRRLLRRAGRHDLLPRGRRGLRGHRRRRAPPRAAAAQPVRLLDVPGELTMDVAPRAQPVRQGRDPRGAGRPRPAAGTCCTTSPSASRSPATWTRSTSTGDNGAVLPTDTQKNTVYAFAREHGVGQIEDFAPCWPGTSSTPSRRSTGATVTVERVRAGSGWADALVRPGRPRDPHGDGDARRRGHAGSVRAA